MGTGVLICTYAAFGILLVNVILTIVAAAVAVARHDQRTMSSATIYKGSCDRTKAWTTGLHLLINVLSTIVLGASSYCMQCLTSPSRVDVDRAHGQRVWLDIGVASVRNLAWADWPRRTLWLVLLVTSIPIHLIYNSAVFFALGTREYEVVLASANFDFDRPPAHYNSSFEECFESNTAMSMSTFYADLPSFDNLTREECIRRYAMDFPTDLGTLILVTSNLTAANQRLQWIYWGNSVANDGQIMTSNYDWLCAQFGVLSSSCTPPKLLSALDQWAASPLVPWAGPVVNATVELPSGLATINGKVLYDSGRDTRNWSRNLMHDVQALTQELMEFPSTRVLQQYLDNSTHWKNDTWAQAVSLVPVVDEVACAPDFLRIEVEGPEYPVEYCLSRKLTEQCELQFSPAICLAVIVCNVFKVLCMLLTARSDRTEIFLTVGDAVASFLTQPDPSTERMCLTSRLNLTQGAQPWRSRREGYLQIAVKDASRPQARAALPPRQRWMRAVHPSQWIMTIGVCLVLLGVGGYLLSLAIHGLQEEGHSTTFSALWQLGFGSATPYTIFSLPHSNVVSMSLLANTPQIAVSIGYFLYNNLLTHMLLAAEHDDYASQRKALRVSWPQGSQRSSYYLSLPYRYSIPLMIASMLLHWLVSGSLFYVAINPIDMLGNTVHANQVITCGYGPIAIVFALILGGVMTSTVVGLGMRRFASQMPIAGSCSAAVSAACHPTGGDDHALKPIMWGEIPVAAVQPNGIDDADEIISEHEIEDREEIGDGCYSPLSSETAGQDGSYGHCSFTSEEVIIPNPSRLYM
ncbi:hypothetical protein CBS147321_7429 [Aspergillus niger]|uniref:DUF6536 domain-containing protein n=1 Tax=Aspergillus niger TaxID=5061 RepID=A0A254U5G0_ASPNG|nr:hypothetical protein CBS11350_6603 [Aspergillus niger]KAI2862056.1 hypothetical protein CBS12448_4521 [Aspergillus niger]KAI2938045.1 hypothetical protein CBS147321_7429 [Aspergillus niger]KAI2957922.1 hypothetical protein CBS147322_1968 [Aspergillus niger]KAI2970473.1 hypothetical protein CBS147324_5485 [Aspergillus niger]